ncbi:MAG: TIGR01777 family oxidoreductase [Myxococcota bacterium]|nr:TIGR01777 family oxidoreductase [Myxococcota bacterium]
MKLIVTGATGFVGSALVRALLARGDAVTVLSRDGERAKQQLGDVLGVTANLEAPGGWASELANAHAVVHLAGESVAAKRWDARQKQVLRDSRVETTREIVEAIAALPAEQRPRALIVASGADYYPFTEEPMFDDDEVTEADAAGDSFLARVCRDWEKESRAAKQYGVRVVSMRTGMIVGRGGGLDKMMTPFKMFVGGRIGSGKQWMPWMHIDDAVAAYIAAIDDDRYQGPINLVTDSVRNAEFAKALGKAMHRPSWMPVPGFAVKAAVGEFAEYVLKGRRVVPKRLRELGFTWKYARLADALADVTAA